MTLNATAATVAQGITPELQAWVSSQSACGQSMEHILQAMVAAGWEPGIAARALQPVHAAPLAAVPKLAHVASGNMVDAGDKWVEVTLRPDLPEFVVFNNLLSAAECEALVAAARPRLARSLTVNSVTGGEALHKDRTSQGMFFETAENNVIRRVEARIARLVGWPVTRGECLQVLRYFPGAQYKPHYDYFDPAAPGTPAILQCGGQRVATLVMYLQEPEAGGATVFPVLGIRVAPKRGSAVFFSYAQAHPCSLSLHGGEPVTQGEKWIATKWLREHEFS